MADRDSTPLTAQEIGEVRAMLAARRWWAGLWDRLTVIADRVKVIGVLAPWVLVFAYLVAGERLREFLGW